MKWISILVNWLLFNLIGLEATSALGSFLSFFITASIEIFGMMTLITLSIGLLRSLIDPTKIKRLLSKTGIVGSHVLASLLGAVTPFCSCSSVPIFIGFIESGIPLGATFSFLITSPIVNEAALALLWVAFGWKVAVIYTLTGILIGIIGGLVIEKMGLEHLLEDYIQLSSKELGAIKFTDMKSRFTFAWSETKVIISKVWKYIFIGLFIGAFIHGWTPDQFLATYAGPNNPFAVILGVIIGVPIYTSNIMLIPIVETLIGKGMGIGTALAFMMAASALSLPEMIMLRKVLKAKLVRIFVLITSSSIILVGYLFNIFLTNIV
ncbi:permease [Acidaminobacter sp. JC074]|uniref:permease n=1 Tax=Acidaminobacter sp. JC074 TaxID=2530199 RepID=UPI001F1178B1|nr:permease [Acidaminobacter sp. JC074]MCH4887501.1 permease [Acidaminobacter sp. JC074]